jgi:hypothetical protein
MLISGNAYEYVQKIRVYPLLRKAFKIEEFGKYIGVKSIDVKCIIYMPPMSERIISKLSSDDVKDHIARLIISAIRDRTNWKHPTECAFETEDLNTAIFLAEMVTYMTGGAWIITSNNRYYIYSEGYYHYIGA